jgi:hypothetical protein
MKEFYFYGNTSLPLHVMNIFVRLNLLHRKILEIVGLKERLKNYWKPNLDLAVVQTAYIARKIFSQKI